MSSTESSPPAAPQRTLDVCLALGIALWWVVTVAGVIAMPWMVDFLATLFVRAWPVFLLAIVLWMTVPVLATILVVRRIRTGDKSGALRLAILPVTAVALWFLAPDIATRLRFHVERSAMVEAIKAQRAPADQALNYFRWGGYMDRERGILFDARDEVLKPNGERSAAWKQAARRCFYQAKPLGDHFYFVQSNNHCP